MEETEMITAFQWRNTLAGSLVLQGRTGTELLTALEIHDERSYSGGSAISQRRRLAARPGQQQAISNVDNNVLQATPGYSPFRAVNLPGYRYMPDGTGW